MNPRLPITGPYTAKDQAKWDQAGKFIGRGSVRSSTQRYADALGDLANTGEYSAGDVVFVSAEGRRTGRLEPDWAELQRAVDARVTFITDVPAQRHSAYNLGEQQVEAFLLRAGYEERTPGRWTPGGSLPAPRPVDVVGMSIFEQLDARPDLDTEHAALSAQFPHLTGIMTAPVGTPVDIAALRLAGKEVAQAGVLPVQARVARDDLAAAIVQAAPDTRLVSAATVFFLRGGVATARRDALVCPKEGVAPNTRQVQAALYGSQADADTAVVFLTPPTEKPGWARPDGVQYLVYRLG